MTSIRERERESMRVCLENHPVLLVHGPEWTGVVRATETILESTEQHDGDEEDWDPVWRDLHPDLTVYDGRSLKADDAREIRENATSLPARWNRRFIFISHIDRPHDAVMPILLKLIEEPPSHFSVIVTTSSDQRVLPAILSRSLRVDVAPSDETEVKWWLQLRGKDQDALRIKACGGDLDVAENLDLGVVRLWDRDWSDAFAGFSFRGDFPSVWSSRLEGMSESTQLACWNLLTWMVASTTNRHRLWSEFGLTCLKARKIVQDGAMNKMMASTLLIKSYAIATTIFKSGK